MKRLITLLILLLSSLLPAFADDINIFLWPSNGPLIQLQPAVDNLIGGDRDNRFGTVMTLLRFNEPFSVGVTVSVLTWTLTAENLSAPLVKTFQPKVCAPLECVFVTNFFLPLVNGPLVAGSLTVNLNGTEETFPFHYGTFAPEPTSFLLLGTGLAAIAWRKLSFRRM